MPALRLLLIRHGQASFGRSNYDALSELGHAQARAVGRHLAAMGTQIDHIIAGDLRRQQDTAVGLIAGMQAGGQTPPDASKIDTRPEWNEYDAEGMFRAYLPQVLAGNPELAAQQSALFSDRRLFQRAFEAVLTPWVTAESPTPPMQETWTGFRQRIQGALASIATDSSTERTVAVVTSGGPIAVSVATALGLDATQTFELNWRIINASVSELRLRPAKQVNAGPRLRLMQFNSADGLRLLQTDGTQWITYR